MLRRRVITSERFFIALASVATLVGCATEHWNGRVERWGSLGEAFRDGKTEGRVRLAHVTRKPHGYGVGALEGLLGEVLILDGDAWVARREGTDVHVRRVVDGDPWGATLLAVAYVPRWRDVSVDRPLDPAEFEGFLADRGRASGLAPPFPFLVEGSFDSIEFHVVEGSCPMADSEPGAPPRRSAARTTLAAVKGTLVGFFAEHSAGVLTHHGSRTHIHVLIPSASGEPHLGHVDAVTLQAGCVLRLPVTR